MARANGVYRRQMADGGSVVTGDTVSRALRAVGARAMTWDNEVYVDKDFDKDDADDQALYAHEVHHLEESGGADVGDGRHDAEEAGAQQIERMVLNRRAAGEDFGGIMRDMRSGANEKGSASRAPGSNEQKETATGESITALKEELERGVPYDLIVQKLARYCVLQLNKTREDATVRRSKHEYL